MKLRIREQPIVCQSSTGKKEYYVGGMAGRPERARNLLLQPRAYFTAPRDSPAMIMRWATSTSSRIGTTINTLRALSISQGRV